MRGRGEAVRRITSIHLSAFVASGMGPDRRHRHGSFFALFFLPFGLLTHTAPAPQGTD